MQTEAKAQEKDADKVRSTREENAKTMHHRSALRVGAMHDIITRSIAIPNVSPKTRLNDICARPSSSSKSKRVLG